MKILECKRGLIYDIGFIDPYFTHEDNLKERPKETEDGIVRSLRFNEHKREILFPYLYE